MPRFSFKTLEQGAATQVYVATNPHLNGVIGRYFVDCKECPLEGKALDTDFTEKTLEMGRSLHQHSSLKLGLAWCSSHIIVQNCYFGCHLGSFGGINNPSQTHLDWLVTCNSRDQIHSIVTVNRIVQLDSSSLSFIITFMII